MRNVVMIRREPGLVSIPLENAVYCENCETASTFGQAAPRTLRIGADRSIGSLDPRAMGPGPAPAAVLAE